MPPAAFAGHLKLQLVDQLTQGGRCLVGLGKPALGASGALTANHQGLEQPIALGPKCLQFVRIRTIDPVDPVIIHPDIRVDVRPPTGQIAFVDDHPGLAVVAFLDPPSLASSQATRGFGRAADALAKLAQ